MSSNWPLYSLSDFINVKHGFAFKGEFFKDERTADLLVTPGNFAIGGGFKSDKFKFYEGPVPEDYVLSEGDLIVTMTDLSKQADTLGYSALVPKVINCRLLHNQRVGLVEFKNDELDRTYLYFLLRSKEYRHHVVSTATGSTVKHSSPTKILSFAFRKPPKDIQMDIGKKLIALEEKIELNTKTNQTLEQIAQAIFKSWFVDFDPVKAKIKTLASGGSAEDAELAAMSAISAKTLDELSRLKTSNPEAFNKLAQTAALFPTAMQDSELGEMPEGWEIVRVGDIVKRLKPNKRYTKKQIEPYGKTPVYEQGLSLLLGFHNDDAGFEASPKDPIFIFGDHTCITHLSCSSFDISSNVIPLKGGVRPTIWTYYAIQGKQKFQEYRRHWSEFIIKDVILPSLEITEKYSELVTSNYLMIEALKRQSKELEHLRDTLLPNILSGEIDLTSEVIA